MSGLIWVRVNIKRMNSSHVGLSLTFHLCKLETKCKQCPKYVLKYPFAMGQLFNLLWGFFSGERISADQAPSRHRNPAKTLGENVPERNWPDSGLRWRVHWRANRYNLYLPELCQDWSLVCWTDSQLRGRWARKQQMSKWHFTQFIFSFPPSIYCFTIFIFSTYIFSEMKTWYEKYINTFLKTWNLLRVSVTSSK